MSAEVDSQKISSQNDTVQVEHVSPLAQEEEDKMTIWQLLKANPKIIAYAVAANAGSLLFGYDIIVNGAVTALPAFQSTYGDYLGQGDYGPNFILPALWQGLWTSIVQIGIMFGALLNGFVQDQFGRKVSFALGGLLSAIGIIPVYLSPTLTALTSRRLALFFGKLILGTSMGISISTCQTYISEISPPKLRGLLLGFFAFVVSLAQMIGITVLFNRILIFDITAFQLPFALQWIFAGLLIVVAVILPESPSYLVSKDKVEGARKSYARLYSSSGHSAAAISRLVATFEEEKVLALSDAEKPTYRECFTGVNRRRTGIIILINVLQQLAGISLIANAVYFFVQAGMSPTQSLQISQVGIGLGMVTTFTSWFTMATWGRRFNILCSMTIIGFLFVAIGIAGLFPNENKALTFIGVGLVLVSFFYGLGVGSAWPVVAAEISTVRLRSRSAGIGFVVNAFASWLFTFTVPYMFNSDEGNLGGKIGFVFAATSVIGVLATWFIIPETKTKSFAELDYLFDQKTPTRAFKKPFVAVTEYTKNEA